MIHWSTSKYKLQYLDFEIQIVIKTKNCLSWQKALWSDHNYSLFYYSFFIRYWSSLSLILLLKVDWLPFSNCRTSSSVSRCFIESKFEDADLLLWLVEHRFTWNYCSRLVFRQGLWMKRLENYCSEQFGENLKLGFHY